MKTRSSVLCSGLAWEWHGVSDGLRCHRRPFFPSWSWVGWAHSNGNYSHSCMTWPASLDSGPKVLDGFNYDARIKLELNSGSIIDSVICLDWTGLDLGSNPVHSGSIAIWLQERHIIHILFIVSLGILWCCSRKLCRPLNSAQIVYITLYILLLKGLNCLKYVFIITLILIIVPTLTAGMLYYCQNLLIILPILFLYLGSSGGSYICSLVLLNVFPELL